MVGVHRDTWSFGAIDATSGTAILLEMARNFIQFTKDHSKIKIFFLLKKNIKN